MEDQGPYLIALYEQRIKVMQGYYDGIHHVERAVKNEQFWEFCGTPTWNWNEYDYRIKPIPQIDWSHVQPEFEWIATNMDNCVLLFNYKPTLHDTRWSNPSGPGDKCVTAETFKSCRPYTGYWKESLQRRPLEA